MNDYLRNKLKEGRNAKRLKQNIVANMIGVKGNTLSNYENGASEPDINTFCALCNIYKLDPAEILGEAYGLHVQGTDFDVKRSEIEQIKKYRALNQHGKEMVDFTLEKEYECSTKIVDFIPSVNAAGERSDATEENKKQNNNIMKNDSEWE